ncbi:MAG TPA: molybdate ABC transporter substrate-binding protein [Acetobacteraceae bacterium]|nr:molybdate ABC transporter substrate-binding protein [Acetobacteraceae bacterium]
MRRLLIVAALLLSPTLAWAQGLTVFAAASLTDALQDVGAAWKAQGHPPIRFSFGASSTLARQIEQGAPADLFASADIQWMNYVDQRHLILPGTRRDLLGNSLVLIVPASHPAHVEIKPGFDLAGLLGPDGRLTTGDPAHVPVGIYAEQALKKLGLWDYAQHHLAPAADVRSALLLVERGEAAAGIVYATDAAVSKSVMVAGTFPADSHPPIVYPFAVIKGGHIKDAEALMQFLTGPMARTIFERRGFKTE